MQHLDEGTIHSWLDGALSAEEAARVEAHVKECAQCQAAVAEARGFIAASSRILTALDNAPRGVIPAAKPTRRIDPMVWRVAATVLVVAAGTLVVVRNSEMNQPSMTRSENRETAAQRSTAPTDQAVTGAATDGAPSLEKSTSSGSASVKRAPAAVSGGSANQPLRAQPPSISRQSRPDVAAVEKRAAPSAAVAGVAERGYNRDVAAAAPQPVPTQPTVATPSVMTPTAQVEAPMLLRGRVAAQNAVAEQRIRDIGPRRALGQKITLYEVAAGDTVQWAEEVRTELQSVVVTGMGVTQAAGAAGVRRTEPSKAAMADSPRPAAAPAAAPPIMPPSFMAGPGGFNTISWRDPVTGNVMKLSGRHTQVELEGIRRGIERLRAAAADSLKRNR